MRRIGADLMLLLDNHGQLLTSTMVGIDSGTENALRRLIDTSDMTSDRLHVMSLAGRPYQFFLAPVRAPDNIGWVAMGFAVDDTLAKRMGELVGTEISLVAAGQGHLPYVASTLGQDERRELATQRFLNGQPERSRRVQLGSQEYLVVSRRLPSNPEAVDVVVARQMRLAPSRCCWR